MKARVWGLVAAIVLAVLGTIAIVAYVNGADDRAQAEQDVVKVYVVQSEIPAGTASTDLGDRVKLESITKQVQAEGAVTNLDQIDGLVSSSLLVKGEQLVKQRFVEPSSYRASGAAVTVPEGLLSTTISLEPQRVLGGVLTPGSTVAVSASFDGPDQTKIVLQKVLVTNVQTSTENQDAANSSSSSSSDTTTKAGTAPQGTFLVTLALNQDDTQKLIYTAEHGSMWLSLDPRTAPDAPTRVMDRGIVLQ